MKPFPFLILLFNLSLMVNCLASPITETVNSLDGNNTKNQLIKKADNYDMAAILSLVKKYNFQETKEGIYSFNKWYPIIENKILNQQHFSPKSLYNSTQVILIYLKYNDMLGPHIDSISKLLHYLSAKGSSEASVSIIKNHLFKGTYLEQLKLTKNSLSEHGLNNLYEYFSALYERTIPPKYKILEGEELSEYTAYKIYNISDSELQTLRVLISLTLQEKGYPSPMLQRIYNIPLFIDDKNKVLSLFEDVIHSNNINYMLSLTQKVKNSKQDYRGEIIKLYQKTIQISSNEQWIEANKNLLSFYFSYAKYKHDYISLKEKLLNTTVGKLAVVLQLANINYGKVEYRDIIYTANETKEETYNKWVNKNNQITKQKNKDHKEIRELIYQIVDNINNKKEDQSILLILTNIKELKLHFFNPKKKNEGDKDWDAEFKDYFLSKLELYISNSDDLTFKNKLFAKYYHYSKNDTDEFHLRLLEFIKKDDKVIQTNNVIELRNKAFQYIKRANLSTGTHYSYSDTEIAKKYNYKYKTLFRQSRFVNRAISFNELQINEVAYSKPGIEYFKQAAFYGDKYSQLKLFDIYQYQEYLARSQADHRKMKSDEKDENFVDAIREFFGGLAYIILFMIKE